MKITRNTPDQLIVENNPVLLAVFVSVFGMIFIAVGLFTFGEEPVTGLAFIVGGAVMTIGLNLAFVRRTQVILDRGRDLVELRQRSWLRYGSMTWALQYLERAGVQTSYSGDTSTHRAVLIIGGGMDAGTHPITAVYSSGEGAHRAEAAINDWLAALDRPDAGA